MVFTAQIPKDPKTGALVPGDIKIQTHRALENLRQSVTAAGGTLRDVTQVIIYLVEAADAPGMNEVYRKFFAEPYPSRATVVVKELLVTGMRIELVAYAVIG